jgi:hypothetical protein
MSHQYQTKHQTLSQPQTTLRTTSHKQVNLSTIQRVAANPRAASPTEILQLQRTLGNRAVGQLLRQALRSQQMTVGPPQGKPEEKAEQMMPMSETPIQRFDDEEETIQAKPLNIIQRNEDDEVKEPPTETGVKLLDRNELKRGDIMLLQGNTPVQWAQGVAGVVRVIAKAVTGIGLGHAAREVARLGNAKFGHAAIYTGFNTYAHATSNGVTQTGVAEGKYLIYRSTNEELGRTAAEVAAKWASKNISYSVLTALKSGVWGSGYDKNRAMTLGLYYKADLAPDDMICSEFAISCYQAAVAQKTIVSMLDQGQLNDLKAQLKNAGEKVEEPKNVLHKAWIKMWGGQTEEDALKKQIIRNYVRGHKGLPWGGKGKNMDLGEMEQYMLRLDPRSTTPQRLAQKLETASKGGNRLKRAGKFLSNKLFDTEIQPPVWEKVGWFVEE